MLSSYKEKERERGEKSLSAKERVRGHNQLAYQWKATFKIWIIQFTCRVEMSYFRGVANRLTYGNTLYLCADITEKSNSTESREPFQGSQNAKTHLMAKATWVTPTQSCHCSGSSVWDRFLPIPLFSGCKQQRSSSFTYSHSFKACCRSCRVAG